MDKNYVQFFYIRSFSILFLIFASLSTWQAQMCYANRDAKYQGNYYTFRLKNFDPQGRDMICCCSCNKLYLKAVVAYANEYHERTLGNGSCACSYRTTNNIVKLDYE